MSAKLQSTKQLVDQFHEFSATAHLQRVQSPIQPGAAVTGHMFSPQTVARVQNHAVDDIHACYHAVLVDEERLNVTSSWWCRCSKRHIFPMDDILVLQHCFPTHDQSDPWEKCSKRRDKGSFDEVAGLCCCDECMSSLPRGFPSPSLSKLRPVDSCHYILMPPYTVSFGVIKTNSAWPTPCRSLRSSWN